jgi:hypothetical protein
MNRYRTSFYAKCPINGIRIAYDLIIDADKILAVEDIIAEVERIDVGFHEDIADTLFARFGGMQTLTANHHSVLIETTRPWKGEGTSP